MRPISRSPMLRHLCCLLAYVFLFQDVTGALAQTPALQTPRVGHTTSILGDGTAAISGGRSTPGGAPTDSAERYDPAAETVAPVPVAGPMTSPRAGHGAASTPAGDLLLGGGEDARGRLSSVEGYLPALGQFVPSALALPGPLSQFTATTLSSGKILVVGGYNGSSLPTATAYLVDGRTQTVVPSKSRLATPRAKHMAALLPDGRVAILGGDTTSSPTASIELYDPAQDAFTVSAVALTTPRAEAAVALLPTGQLLVTGGRGPDGAVRADSELVDLVKGTVAPGPALPGPRAGHTLTLLPDARLLLAAGTDGQRALTTLDRLARLSPDTTPPSVVHVSPPDNAQDVPVDAILAIRFSEPVRVSTVTTATVVLTGPSGRVEGSVATAEAGLLAFFTPSLLESDTPYTLALAGITDTSGNPLPAFSSRFRTGKSAGEAPRVASFSPTSGGPGDEITLRGERFTGATGAGFGGIAAASFSLVNDTTLKVVVPTGAVTGPLSVTTPAGTGSSQGYFVVLSRPDFRLAAAPDRGEVIQGDQYAFAVNVVPSGGFLDMVRLSVSGLPAQLAATFDKAQVGPVGYAYLTVSADARVRPGNYPLTVTGISNINGKDVTRTAEATLHVAPPAGTSLSGQLVRLDGTPIANYTVRVGRQGTRTDAGGNFLLRHLKVEKKDKYKKKDQGKYDEDEDLVLVLDGRTAQAPSGLLYPVFEKLIEYEYITPNKPNRFGHHGPMYIPTMDPKNAVRAEANSSRDQLLKFPQFPGMEIKVPARTTFTDIDGKTPSSILVHVVETPLHLAQMHLQHLPPGVGASALLSIQLGGTVPSKPLPVTSPNMGHSPPGTRVPLYFYDVTKGGFYSPGQGTVSDDGLRVVPDPGVAMTRFGCHPPGPPPVPPGDRKPACDHDCVRDGPGDGEDDAEEVDVASGVFHHQETDLDMDGEVPVTFDRDYRSDSVQDGPFGIGTEHNFDIRVGEYGGVFQLILPSGGRILFDADHVHRATRRFYGARYAGNGNVGWIVTLRNGTQYNFTGGGLLLSIVDRNGNQITITRDSQNRITEVTEPGGRWIAIEYDSQNRIIKLTGPMDQTVTYTYTPQGDLETVTNPVGGVTRYTYDSDHNLLTITNLRGIVALQNEYDPTTKRLIRQTRADGGVWQYTYTPPDTVIGTVTQTVVTDPRGKTRTYTFTGTGRVTSVTNHLGQTTTLTRAASPPYEITAVVDHLGRRTELAYDANKNITLTRQFKDPPANTQPVTQTFTYDLTYNLLTSYTDPLSHTWTFGLDAAAKNVVSATDPLTHTTTFTRSSRAQIIEITDPLGHKTYLDYDPTYGFLTSVRDHLGNTATYTYDLLGRPITETDPRGFTGRTTYDLLNRIVQVADPLGRAIRFEYDPNSNPTKVIDPRGGETTYTYTSMDYLDTRTDPLGRPETWTYDLLGNPTSYRDRKNQPTTWDPYDDLNRPTVVRFPGGTTFTYGFDAASRLQALTDSVAGVITWGYDNLDRVTSETTSQGTIAYATDEANRPTSMTVAGQSPVTYAFDNANRLQSIAKDTLNASVGYDIANRPTSLTLPNGITLTYAYDEADRLTSVVYALGATELGRLTYAYNPNGQQTSMGGTWARTVLPNALSSASYDAANRQLTLGGKSMTYDSNGNLSTLTEGGNTTTFTWDARDRLTNLAGPGLSASFSYDATGRRTSKTVAGFETTFQYDGADIVRTVEGGEEIVYFRGLGMDQPLARISSTGVTCYVPGALGSTWALSDLTTANILTTYTYGPFGQTTVSGSPTNNPFQYTGRENDGTGLYYYRARYYHPGLSRFIAEDPIGFAGGDANLYAYVGNDPVNAADPLGLASNWWPGVVPPNAPPPNYYAYPVGAPRWWEHLIPLWGCGRAMINDFQCGNYWGAALNAGCLALEATALGAAATKAWKWGKGAWKAWKARKAKTPLWSSTKTKSAAENAFAHWKKHGSEFPELQNAKQYADRAKEFVNKPPPGTLTKTRPNGDKLYYDPNSNTFAVQAPNGAPRTMFRPRDGNGYWNRQ